MLFRTLLKLKERNGLTDDLKNKIDIFFATGRITEEQYNELMNIEENIQVKQMEIRAVPQGLIFLQRNQKAKIECGRNFIADI